MNQGPKVYNEFQVISFKEKSNKPDEMRPTKRGSVSIYPHEAELNNSNVRTTRLFYERAEGQPKDKSDELAAKTKTELLELAGDDADQSMTKAQIISILLTKENS